MKYVNNRTCDNWVYNEMSNAFDGTAHKKTYKQSESFLCRSVDNVQYSESSGDLREPSCTERAISSSVHA